MLIEVDFEAIQEVADAALGDDIDDAASESSAFEREPDVPIADDTS
jgi:hypothetical protein